MILRRVPIGVTLVFVQIICYIMSAFYLEVAQNEIQNSTRTRLLK